MTNKDAIEHIKSHMKAHAMSERNAVLITEALQLAIKALEDSEKNSTNDNVEKNSTNDSVETSLCSCWKQGHWYYKDFDTCMGTKEQEPCTCKGNRENCDFYNDNKENYDFYNDDKL